MHQSWNTFDFRWNRLRKIGIFWMEQMEHFGTD
nr:MAG TPA: hypothetical protein [Caudoviricetes sp.]